MSTVDKVIYDALAKRHSVILPGVGSLVVKRRSAKKMPGDRIIPPQNVVSFTEEEIAEGDSVVLLLTAEGELGDADAAAQYASWLEGARSERGLAIEDAGEVRDGKFVIAPSLHTVLNPVVEESVMLEKEEKRGAIWPWVVLGIVLAGVALVLMSYFGNGFLGIQKKPKEVEVVTPVVAPVVAEPAAEDIVIAPPVEPAFHVIAGSFAEESNADNYVKKLQKAYPELSVQKIKNRLNGNWLVSIFSDPTERRAYNAMNKYWDIDIDLWVYEQK
jgi:hypothetical protein